MIAAEDSERRAAADVCERGDAMNVTPENVFVIWRQPVGQRSNTRALATFLLLSSRIEPFSPVDKTSQ
jgi:hypothetical protein